MHILKKGNNNTKRFAYTALVRRILEYGEVWWDPYSEGQVSVLSRSAKFANNINELGWESLAQRRLICQICTIFKAYIRGRTLKAIRNRLLKPWYLSRGDHNRKIRIRKQRTDVGKYSCVNRTIKRWNQLTGGLLASFPFKIHTFRKRVKNVATSKGIQVGIVCK